MRKHWKSSEKRRPFPVAMKMEQSSKKLELCLVAQHKEKQYVVCHAEDMEPSNLTRKKCLVEQSLARGGLHRGGEGAISP